MEKMRKFILSLMLAVCMTFAPVAMYASTAANSPKAPSGFVQKAENSVFALYASSASMGVSNAFICTVTAVKKVNGGYILLGAGHCTSANPDLPSDLTYAVSPQMASSPKDLSPIFLIKSEMNEPLDYAIYYYPTNKNIPVMKMGDERKAKVGDKTIDINFSLGIVKEFSPGIVVSMTIPAGPNYIDGTQGFFEVQEFDSHGASGSSVIDMHGKKIIGLVIAGVDGATIPSFIEPISTVEKAIQGYKVPVITPAQLKAAQDAILNPPPAPIDPGDDGGPNTQQPRSSSVNLSGDWIVTFDGQTKAFGLELSQTGDTISGTFYSFDTTCSIQGEWFPLSKDVILLAQCPNADYIFDGHLDESRTITGMVESTKSSFSFIMRASMLHGCTLDEPVRCTSVGPRGNHPQHGTSRPSEPRSPRPNPPQHQHPSHPTGHSPQAGRRSPAHSGRHFHQRFHGSDVRMLGGHACVMYNGAWFYGYGGLAWPEWFFGGDVYFVNINGQWFVVSYANSDLMFQVVIYE
jgi:hypothetical protein